MNPDQARALTAISMFAAFADGAKSDPEREKVREVVDGLGEVSTSEAARRVLLRQTTVAQEAAILDTQELRALAWEAAVGVCEADGVTTPAERAFLEDLARLLGRSPEAARAELDQADEFTRAGAAVATNAAVTITNSAPLPPPLPIGFAAPLAVAAAGAAASSAFSPTATTATSTISPTAADPRTTQADATTLKFAIITAAAELLPQNLATVAIIPLQTKMVHSIAGAYGYPLSAAMMKEFIATIGVGAAGQVVESYARKFLGQLAKQYLGKSAGKVASTAINWGTGPALTFATTYAIGMVAKQYYAGGRTISAIDLRTLFSAQVEKAKGLYGQYEPQIRQTASTTSPTQLLGFLRGA